jgi:fructose/tagatose bisphosphate aldolase
MASEKTMDTLLNVLTRLQKQGAALGHFNVADLVLVKAVFSAASENRAAGPDRCV